jgi:hypothetical protein
MEHNNIFMKTFTKLDGFGATVDLKLLGDKQDKNLIGALISIFMLAMSLALTFPQLQNYLYNLNPTITNGVEYGINELNFTLDNFYFAISFFQPNGKDVTTADNTTNDFDAIGYINQLNITCPTCNGTYSKSAKMNFCSPEQFQGDMSLKSMSQKKSKSLLSIFSKYSFCLPEDMSGVIKDNEDPESTNESTLQIYIPFSDVSYQYVDVGRNNAAPKSIQLGASETVAAPQPAMGPAPAPTNQQQPGGTQPQQQPGSTQPGGTQPQQQPGGDQPQQQPGSTQPSGSTGGTQPPSGSTGGTQPPSGSTGGTQPPSGSTGGTQPPSGSTGGTQPPSGSTGGTQPPSGSTGGTSPPPSGTTSSSTSSPPSGTTSTSTGGGGSSPPPPPSRILLDSKRMLQIGTTTGAAATNTGDVTADTAWKTNVLAYFQNEVFPSNKFPKMLFLHRSIEISTKKTDTNDIVNQVYYLDIVDYKDPLTSNPMVYNIYIQKYIVSVDRGALFGGGEEPQSFLVVKSIEKNNIDSIVRGGAYLSYKIYGDALVINVKYTSFTDVLGTFGSFYSIFSLLAGILSGLYNEIFLTRKIINAIFKFVDNQPDHFGRHMETKFNAAKENDLIKNEEGQDYSKNIF